MKVVSPCLVRDLPSYRIAHQGIISHFEGAKPHVMTRGSDFPKFKDALGSDVELIDEDDLMDGLSFEDVRRFPLPFFPAGAGWYFQQFLKWAFASRCGEDEGYLIWDADTVPLRPLRFKDASGRTLLTSSDEYHPPYFETFESVVGMKAVEHISFISQHQWMEPGILRELTARIESRTGEAWPWAILKRLCGDGTNLFSEYETYGHYLRLRHPEKCVVRELPWTRDGRRLSGFPPSPAQLEGLAERFAFASFESNRSLKGWCVHRLRRLLNWY